MKQKITNKEYSRFVNEKSPKSKTVRNIIRAFIVGGIICMIGQGIWDLMYTNGANKEDASVLTSIIMIFIGVLLTALNIYSRIGKFAGAGSIVPITGFANSIVAPAIEYKSEGYVMGIGARMFIIAGPVLVYGISTSIIIGFIYYFFKIVTGG